MTKKPLDTITKTTEIKTLVKNKAGGNHNLNTVINGQPLFRHEQIKTKRFCG